MRMQFSDLIGVEIEPYIDRLAELRISVFREYPYLYEGNLEYERKYLQKLADSPHGYVVLAKDGERVVGASTALPLTDAEAEFSRPFTENGLDPEDYFYFGESVLLPEYRGRGIGRKFFQERLAQAHFLAFPWSCFCAVVRPETHPARPAGYRPLDGFWSELGFSHRPDLVAKFSWPDLAEAEESEKTLQFWLRKDTMEF